MKKRNSALMVKPGHLAKGGPIVHSPSVEGGRKGALAANRKKKEEKLPPIVLNWTRK